MDILSMRIPTTWHFVLYFQNYNKNNNNIYIIICKLVTWNSLKFLLRCFNYLTLENIRIKIYIRKYTAIRYIFEIVRTMK